MSVQIIVIRYLEQMWPCCSSVNDIAIKNRLNKESVRQALKQLVAKGIVELTVSECPVGIRNWYRIVKTEGLVR